MGLRLLALACLVGAAFAGPVQRHSEIQSDRECNSSPSHKLGYKPGKAYVYHIQSQNNITYHGVPKHITRLEAKVEFHMLSQCDGYLKMKNIRLEQRKTSQGEKDDLERQLGLEMGYSYKDGEFKSVCPSPQESTQSLNIKKALLSSLVIEIPSLEKSAKIEERDSFGKCVTNYHVHDKNGEKVITKKKDLKTCSNKKTSLNFFKKIQDFSLSIFKKDHLMCTQHIQDGVFKNIHCQEHQKVKSPQQNGNSWIEFSGKLKLNLIETKSAERQPRQETCKEEDILFNVDETRLGDRNVNEVERVLKSICSEHKSAIGMTIGKDYIQLVPLVKKLSYDDLYRIYKSLTDGKLCDSKKVRDIFADTLPIVLTDPAIKLMVEIMVNDEATGLKSKYWPLTLAMRQNPTEDTVAAVLPLVQRKSLSTPTLIGVTSLVHRVCSSEDCGKIGPVREIVKVYNGHLGSGCSADNEKQIRTSLRAFGNMGYHGEAHQNIVKCAKNKALSKLVRIHAIESFRLLNSTRPQEFVQMFSDRREDNEIRIELLRSISQHPEKKQLIQIKRVAEAETSEQVSGYMYTLFQNINKTQSSKHREMRGMLQDVKIRVPEVNYLRNSKNIEFSAYNEVLQVGASIETDVIHGGATNIPTSSRNRFDLDMFGENYNIFEWGVRTHGLEDIIQNILAMKDKIPKVEEIHDWLEKEPTVEEMKEKLRSLSRNILGDTRPELSIYFRALEMEIFEKSTSDMSGMKEMLQMAELMSKLAHGKKADFSHSVVLMNSKLAIPSVTGRSYSVDLVGTSTVGVTAETKADFLKLPRHADIHLRAKPSVTVGVELSVGMQSRSHIPALKAVSRWHSESDVDARFQIKDGHAVLASLNLPSEKIAAFNMSTNVFEIDEENNEKPIFESMQKKIDHCFEQLSKPLGVSPCFTLEVPKPFVTKKFPFVYAFGNAAATLKKTDTFHSYEFRAEIPKQAGPSMKFRASFDTPGSKVSRRFAADLEIKQERDQKDVLVELVTPFESFGGKGSLTKNQKLIKGSVELHSSKKQIASAHIGGNVTKIGARKTIKVEGAYSILNQDPVGINGTITVTKGRKEHISIDFKTNKPRSQPIALKATIMKEGRIEFSRKSEWKLSSDVSMRSPMGDWKLSKTVEKRSKQSQSLSANVGLDYQLKGKKKQSITISSTSQQSSNKLNTNVKVVSTQYPKANMHLTWDMQRESPESMRNDITIKKGERPLFHLEQKSRMPKTGPSSCSAAINIPSRDIHYEFSVTSDIDIKEQPRINIEADLCYKEDKHIRGIIDVKYESFSPLKASGKVELEYPGLHLMLEDEVEETDGVIEGRSKLQYQNNQITELHYKYKKLSNDSKFHHEIESSIQTPSSRNPVNMKASVELNSESFAIVGQVGPHHAVKAHLKRDGDSEINIKLPMIEGTIKSKEEDKKKTVDIDMKVKTRRARHIIGSVTAETGEKKKFELRIQPDVDHAPEKKIILSTAVEKTPGDSFVSATKLKIFDIVDLSLAEQGKVRFLGAYKFVLEADIKNHEPMAMKFETDEQYRKMTIEITKNNDTKGKIEYNNEPDKKGFSVKTGFSDIDMDLKSQISHSESSKNVQATLFLKKNDKVYKTEWSSDIQPNGLEVKAQMHTPHENYEKNAIGFSIQVSDNAVSSSINVDCLDNKRISIQTEFKAKNHACSFVAKLSTPFEIAKESQVQVTLENHRSKKSLKANIDVNNARICNIQGNLKKFSEEIQLEGSLKVSNLPKVKFQGFDIKLQKSPSDVSVSGRVQLENNQEITLVSEIKEEGSVIHTTTSLATPYKNWKDAKAHLSIEIQPSKRSLLCYFDKNGERKGDAELSITTSSQSTEVKGRLKTVRTPEISAHVKSEKTGKSFSLSANVMKGTSPLLSTSFNKLSYHGGEKLLMKTKSFEDTLLDFEISREVSGENSETYSCKIKGPTHPISITFSKNRNDKNSISTELRVCREAESLSCYKCKSYHKSLLNSENYRLYQQVTMDLEKSVGSSVSQPMGRLHLLVSATENDYKSKVILEVNEKKLGSELTYHRRQNENDRCSLDSHIYLPQRTVRVMGDILHSHQQVHFEAVAIPDTNQPSHKLLLEVKKQMNPDTKEVSGYMKLSHPRMSQPLLLTCKSQPVGEYFQKVKVVLHSGPVWGKVLKFEAIPNIEQEAYGIRSMEYLISTDDKSIDASMKLIRQSSRTEEKMGWEWKWATHDESRKGGLTLTLSDKNGGKPKTVKVSYYSPSLDYEVQGSVAQGPEDINLSVSSAGRKLKEIRISLSDSCANIEVTKSGPLFKSQICVNHREGSALHLLKVNVHYRQHKCLDIRVGVDPEKPEYIDVVYKCSKERACRAVREMISSKSLQELKQHVIKKLRQLGQDVHEKLRHIEQDVVEPHLRKARKSLQNLKDDLSSKLRSKLNQHEKLIKEYIRKLKEAQENVLNRMKSAIPSSLKEICQKFYQDYREVTLRCYRKVIQYWPAGWNCNYIKSVFRRFDVQEAKKQIHRKLNNIKQSLKFRLPRFRMIWPSDVLNMIKKGINTVQNLVIRIFGKVVGKTIMFTLRRYAKKVEALIRQKAMDFIDNIFKKFRDMASRDEDIRTAQDMILNAKNEIVKAWRNKEELANITTRRIENNIEQHLRKIWNEEVKDFKHDPENGELSFKVRQHLSKDDIQKLTQGLYILLQKLQEYLHR